MCIFRSRRLNFENETSSPTLLHRNLKSCEKTPPSTLIPLPPPPKTTKTLVVKDPNTESTAIVLHGVPKYPKFRYNPEKNKNHTFRYFI
mmetsp:Transcript_4218/g.5939  ORF Transcript_4218/g.5939 Transcript_4218/m.5939 type:complete len:89 (-) Transcript_4218:266-532(-)